MDWTIIEKITNHPVFISLVSIAALIGLGIIILSKSGLGKKAISKLTDLVSATNQRAKETKELVAEQTKVIGNIGTEVKEFKGEVVSQVKVALSQFEFFENSMYSILSQIPNAKVQEQLNAFKSQWIEKKKEIIAYVGGSFSELDDKVKEIETKKDAQIDALSSKIASLEKMVETLAKTTEKVENGERKETINEEGTEE